MLAAIIVGGLIRHFAPETGVALNPLGDGFIRLVKLIIAPVIFVTGIAAIDPTSLPAYQAVADYLMKR